MAKYLFSILISFGISNSNLYCFGGLLEGLYRSVEDFDPEIRARKDAIKQHQERAETIKEAVKKHKEDSVETDKRIARLEKQITLLKLSSDGSRKQEQEQRFRKEMQEAQADKLAHQEFGNRIQAAIEEHRRGEAYVAQLQLQIEQSRHSKIYGTNPNTSGSQNNDSNLVFDVLNLVSGNPKGRANKAMQKAFSLGEVKISKQEMIQEMQRNNFSVSQMSTDDIEMSYTTFLALQKAREENFEMGEEQKRNYRYALKKLRDGQFIASVAAVAEGSKEALIVGGMYVMDLQKMVGMLVNTMREIHHISPSEEEVQQAEKQMDKKGGLDAFGDSLAENAKPPIESKPLSPAESMKQKLADLKAKRQAREDSSEE